MRQAALYVPRVCLTDKAWVKKKKKEIIFFPHEVTEVDGVLMCVGCGVMCHAKVGVMSH